MGPNGNMAESEIRHTLVCTACGRRGEFVYEKANAKGPRINFESLTPGFQFRDTGYSPTSTISCAQCNEVVFPYSAS
jgi:hypothetical protein